MVGYNVGKLDANDLSIGTYHTVIKSPSRGPNKNEAKTFTFQVKRRSDGSHYWSKVKQEKLVNGIPPQLTARALGIEPSEDQISMYETHKVYADAAFNLEGEHASSRFVLKRRKKGDVYIFSFSPLVHRPRKAQATRAKKAAVKKPSPKKRVAK